ncbi:MAG TPA: hypothetical protein VHO25_19310, partial [Polyangiaceae bacterium]|nr:hypothetical protein [Polyangiaceae bacterium]
MSHGALAQQANEEPPPPSTEPGKPSEEAPTAAEEKPAEALGYIPGQRRVGGLGLSPHSPRVPSLPGGTTIPFGAPDKTRGWQFNISGWASAALRVSSGSRDNATTDQHVTTLHTPPRTPDFYGA